MKKPAPADLRRWSDEVARDPTSLAFLPLARAYRRQGQREAARQLCLRGLEQYPTHAEAHSLLALLYLEDGDRAKAADEWSMVLRIDPNHFESLRGIGFCYLEQDQLSRARQALERAALLRPHDPAVQEALHVLGTRQELHTGSISTSASHDDMELYDREADRAHATTGGTAQEGTADGARAADDAQAAAAAGGVDAFAAGEPWAATPQSTTEYISPPAFSAVAPSAPVDNGDPAANTAQLAAPASSGDRARSRAIDFSDPSSVFDSIVGVGPLMGVLLIDAQGLVLAGSLSDVPGSEPALGAMIGPAIAEAGRTATHLSLGRWKGMLIECGSAVLHVSPVTPTAFVILAARRAAPSGWMLRNAALAADIAVRYLEEYG